MTLAIVTPSYAPDFLRFRRLHESVVQHAPPDVTHHVLVPALDVNLFSSIDSSRLRVLRQSEVLPRHFLMTTRLSRVPRLPSRYRVGALNLRRPWPPIRGWVLQQIVKLAFVSTLDADVALLIDSDVLLVRGFSEETFRREGCVRHYRAPQAVHAGMTRHLNWRQTAARLLDLGKPSDDHADYNAGVVSWSPTIVRDLLARIEAVASLPWATAIGSQLDVSEYFLYGEYLAAMGTPAQKAFTSDQNLCHSYWDSLTLALADEFVESMPATDIAILVQSNSGTGESVLDHIAAKVRES
ncbi:MAG: DUF6492 family protein [Propionibacteriaceae bacterium]